METSLSVSASPPDNRPGQSAALPILGWKERVSLPEWGIDRLPAKLDTGARSSALHVTDLEVLDPYPDDGELCWLRFAVVLGSAPGRRRRVTTPATGIRTVRDSGARRERRLVVRTRVVCGPLDRVADVTITDRSGMNFRMILGRTTLEGACLVDPQHGYLHSRPPAVRRRPPAGADRLSHPRASA